MNCVWSSKLLKLRIVWGAPGTCGWHEKWGQCWRLWQLACSLANSRLMASDRQPVISLRLCLRSVRNGIIYTTVEFIHHPWVPGILTATEWMVIVSRTFLWTELEKLFSLLKRKSSTTSYGYFQLIFRSTDFYIFDFIVVSFTLKILVSITNKYLLICFILLYNIFRITMSTLLPTTW